MKYLIILLTSLFLVSTASAEHRGYEAKTVKETCEHFELQISIASDNIILMWESTAMEYAKEVPNRAKLEKNSKQSTDIKVLLLDYSKIYHYLDCREELGR